MNRLHAISDEALECMEGALATGHPWVAYNEGAYLLGNEDILAFRTKIDAILFAAMKHEEHEEFRVIYAPSLTDLFRQIPYENEMISSPQKINTMQENNLDHLKKNLLYTGFPDSLHAELEKNMGGGSREFRLAHRFEFNGQQMDTTLHFRKGDKADLYFFNRYEAHLYDRKDAAYDRQQSFQMIKGNEITAKEAFNLLSGRAVNKDLVSKEGEKYNAWVQLDFSKVEANGNYAIRRYTPNWGFDLERSLDALGVKELASAESKTELIRSLEKGNLQSAKADYNGKEHTIFLQANPRDRSLDAFDSRMKPLDLDMIAKRPDQSPDQKTPSKPDPVNGDPSIQNDQTDQKTSMKPDHINGDPSIQKDQTDQKTSMKPDHISGDPSIHNDQTDQKTSMKPDPVNGDLSIQNDHTGQKTSVKPNTVNSDPSNENDQTDQKISAKSDQVNGHPAIQSDAPDQKPSVHKDMIHGEWVKRENANTKVSSEKSESLAEEGPELKKKRTHKKGMSL